VPLEAWAREPRYTGRMKPLLEAWCTVLAVMISGMGCQPPSAPVDAQGAAARGRGAVSEGKGDPLGHRWL
jgi:hypothetical protein